VLAQSHSDFVSSHFNKTWRALRSTSNQSSKLCRVTQHPLLRHIGCHTLFCYWHISNALQCTAISGVVGCVAVGVLQCVAVRCSVLLCVAVRCSALRTMQCVAVRCNALQCVVVGCSALQCVAAWCNVLQCVAVCCSLLQRVAACCSVLQHVAAQLSPKREFKMSWALLRR